VEFDGALYHVIVWGNQREKIFRGERDCLSYLERRWSVLGDATTGSKRDDSWCIWGESGRTWRRSS